MREERCAQLTPTAGRAKLAMLRPQVDAKTDLARARGLNAGVGEPSRFPGEPPLYVGSGAHAANVKLLKRLGIGAVINCAPSVCADPEAKYKASDIQYKKIDAHDDRSFPLLKECLGPATQFIDAAHAENRGVLVHCMAGVNRSATLAVAHLLIRDKPNLFTLFEQCVAARHSILQNPSFQLQLCSLAQRHGLLCEPKQSPAAMPPEAPPRADEATAVVDLTATAINAGTAAAAGIKQKDTAGKSVLLDQAPEDLDLGGRGGEDDPTAGALKPVALTGNRDMAEDLEREECPTCHRTFAPSVLRRHAPMCEARASKKDAKNRPGSGAGAARCRSLTN